MNEHTAEPWQWIDFGAWGDQLIYGPDAKERPIATAYAGRGKRLLALANAQRIVACVNACAGMDDPAAEIAGLRASYKELCDIRADKVLFLPRPGYNEGAISINLSVAEQEGAIRDKLADMGWARPDEAKQLRAENARLREALQDIAKHPGTQSADMRAIARAALRSGRRKAQPVP